MLVGVGSGSLRVGMLDKPYEATVRSPYWGSRSELFEVLDLARSGAIHVETEIFTLDEAPRAYKSCTQVNYADAPSSFPEATRLRSCMINP